MKTTQDEFIDQLLLDNPEYVYETLSGQEQILKEELQNFASEAVFNELELPIATPKSQMKVVIQDLARRNTILHAFLIRQRMREWAIREMIDQYKSQDSN